MKILAVFVAFVVCCGFSCRYDETCNPVRTGEEVVLLHGKIYCLDGPSSELIITDISEGRCPEGVVCFWQGEVTVSLSLKTESAEHEIVLRSVLNPADTTAGYIFSLLDVLPYPKYKQPVSMSDYRITLKIDKPAS
jgi:hypothetical protein